MSLANALSPNVVRAGASTGVVSAVQAATNGSLEVNFSIYSAIAMVLGLLGVVLARLVTISEEDKRLGRKQTWRETGPLTWVGVLIVCPFIWHFQIAVPWASMIGLGVGYSVRIVLKIFGGGAVRAARAIAKNAAEALEEDEPAPRPRRLVPDHHPLSTLPPSLEPFPEQRQLEGELDRIPYLPPTADDVDKSG